MRLPLVAATMLLCCSAHAEADSWDRVFPAADITNISIETTAGGIDVFDAKVASTSPNYAIKVRITKPQKKDACRISMALEGTVLQLKALNPKGLFKRKACKAGFTVSAPEKLSITATSGAGDIHIDSRRARVTGYSGAGNILITNVSGDLKATTGSGKISGKAYARKAVLYTGSGEINLRRLLGTAEVQTGSGDITLRWAQNPRHGKSTFRSGSGNINLTFPKRTSLHALTTSGSGRVRNAFGYNMRPTYRILVRTGSGDINIKKGSTNVVR